MQLQKQNMMGVAASLSSALNDIERAARTAADSMQASAGGWMFRPAAEFRTAVEPRMLFTDGDVRLCLMFLVLLIKDIMQNLSGDVPYDVLGQAVDAARANV